MHHKSYIWDLNSKKKIGEEYRCGRGTTTFPSLPQWHVHYPLGVWILPPLVLDLGSSLPLTNPRSATALTYLNRIDVTWLMTLSWNKPLNLSSNGTGFRQRRQSESAMRRRSTRRSSAGRARSTVLTTEVRRSAGSLCSTGLPRALDSRQRASRAIENWSASAAVSAAASNGRTCCSWALRRRDL